MDRELVNKCGGCRWSRGIYAHCTYCKLSGTGHPYFEAMKADTKQSAFESQVGGAHYTSCAIQPFEYSMANKLDPMQHTIVKYVTRFRTKNGIEDLKKARHTIDLLIEWEEKHGTKTSPAN